MKVSVYLIKYATPLTLLFLIIGCAINIKDINKWKMEGSEGIPKLIKVAEDIKADSELRLAAVEAMGRVGGAQAVPPLLRLALADKDLSLRKAAVNALIAIGRPALEALIKVAQDPKADVNLRLPSVRFLSSVGDARAVQLLLEIALGDMNSSMREEAVNGLIAIGKLASEALIRVAEDTKGNVRLRLATLKVLGNMGDTQTVQPMLRLALADKDLGLRKAAVNALIAIGRPALEALIKVAQDPKADVNLRLPSVRFLSSVGDVRSIQPLLGIALGDMNSSMREEAVNGLIAIGKPASEALIKVAEAPTSEVKLRLASLKTLGSMGDARIVQPLLGIALADKEPAMREAAVNALIGLGKPATDALIKLAQDPRSEVKLRLAAVKALENAGDGRAVHPLLGILLTDKDPRMREAVNSVLVAMGRQATVGGSVQKIDKSSQTIIITTPMGKREVLQLSPATSIKKQNRKASLKDLSSGQDVKMEYLALPGDKALVTEVLVGVYVPHCSCGKSCPCPISRGCKVVEYD